MKRREFIGLISSAAVAPSLLPLAARAQQASNIPKLGALHPTRSENVAAFIAGLTNAGYVDGQNVRIETRIYGTKLDQLDRLGDIADELVNLQCKAIFAAGPYAIRAALKATSIIPVVGIDLESDPVANGWITSLSRPGGNLTGTFLDLPELSGKQIELLRETLPTLTRLGIIWDSTIGSAQFHAAENGARAAGIELQSFPIQSSADFENAFHLAKIKGVDGIIILSSPIIFGERVRLGELTLNARLPTISLFNQFPRFGMLMAYGPSLPAMYKRAALYIDQVFRGTKAGEIPIERPTRFELAINLKTAKALGLTIPPELLLRADEVIE